MCCGSKLLFWLGDLGANFDYNYRHLNTLYVTVWVWWLISSTFICMTSYLCLTSGLRMELFWAHSHPQKLCFIVKTLHSCTLETSCSQRVSWSSRLPARLLNLTQFQPIRELLISDFVSNQIPKISVCSNCVPPCSQNYDTHVIPCMCTLIEAGCRTFREANFSQTSTRDLKSDSSDLINQGLNGHTAWYHKQVSLLSCALLTSFTGRTAFPCSVC